FDSDGNPLRSVIAIAARQGLQEHESQVGMDSQGNFVVSFTSGDEVRVSMRFADGSFRQNISATSGSLPGHVFHHSSIAVAPDGGFALAYEEDIPTLPISYANLDQYNSDGMLQVRDTAGVASSAPTVSVDDQGNPVLAYISQSPGGTTFN